MEAEPERRHSVYPDFSPPPLINLFPPLDHIDATAQEEEGNRSRQMCSFL